MSSAPRLRAILAGAVLVVLLAVGAAAAYLRDSSPSAFASPEASASAPASVASAAESATAEPAEPVSITGEEEGIRLTLELDRGRSDFGQRVWGDVTIENIGPDSVFWGHSGTCVFPATISAAPDAPRPMPIGREDWPGDLGILKSISVFPQPPGLPVGYGFTPDVRVDVEGNLGCTSDLQISELPPGEALTQRAAWDTVGMYWMPPESGRYTVSGTFAFMSRGAPPGFDENVPTDAFRVSAALPYVVDADDAGMSPGFAVDAILRDGAFRQVLDGIARERWTGADIRWVEGRWVLELDLTDPAQSLRASVDAVSGAFVGVEVVPRDEGPGG